MGEKIKWHLIPQDEIFKLLQSSVEGITQEEAEALQRKSEVLKERLQQNLLPLLSGGRDSSYFIENNATYGISFLGLSEAVRTFIGASLNENEKATDFATKILKGIIDFTELTS